MPQTLASFDAVLKEFYQNMVVSQIENKTRLLKSFSETEGPSADGRRVIFPLHVGRNTGVMSSVEGATLPTAGRQAHVDITIPLRKTVGRINVTKDVIDASRSNRGAFKRAMSVETDGLIRDVSDYRNEMLCNYGSGIVARVDGNPAANATAVDLRAPGGFAGTVNPNRFAQTGMILAGIRTGAIVANTPVTLTAVEEGGGYNGITLAANTADFADGDYLVRAATTTVTAVSDTDWQNPIMGLFGLVDDGTYVQTIHGINRTTYPVFRSFVLASVGALSLDSIQRALDGAEMKGQGTINEMWAEHGVRRAYLTLLEADRRYTSEKLMKPDGGTTAAKGGELTFGGIPLMVDRDMPYGFLVGVDKDVLERYVNVRGQWEDEDGRVLDRSINTHDFTGLWYMRDNFSINRPNACFRMDGITTTALAIHID